MLEVVSPSKRHELDEVGVEDASRRGCQPWQMTEHISSTCTPNNRLCLGYVLVNLHTRNMKVQGKTSNPMVVSAR